MGIFQARILEWVAMPSSRGIFLTQELKWGLQHCRQILYQVSYQGRPNLCYKENRKSGIHYLNNTQEAKLTPINVSQI